MNATYFSFIFAVFAVPLAAIYSVMAMQYMFAVNEHERPWYEKVEAAIVGDDFTSSPVMEQSQDYYRDHHVPMFIHTICGGLALSLQLIQLTGVHFDISSIKKYHRKLGYAIALFLFVNLAGSLTFLIFTWENPSDHTYGGYISSIFNVGLAGVWLIAFFTGVLFIVFARQHHRERHMLMATWNHSALWSAPSLRLGWIWIGLLIPSLSKEEANFLASVWMVPLLQVFPLVYVPTKEEYSDKFKWFTVSLIAFTILGLACSPIDSPYQDAVDPFYFLILSLTTLSAFSVALYGNGKQEMKLRYLNQGFSTMLFVAGCVWFFEDDRSVMTGSIPFQGLVAGLAATIFSTCALVSRNFNYVLATACCVTSMWSSFFFYHLLESWMTHNDAIAFLTIFCLSLFLSLEILLVCYHLPLPLQQVDYIEGGL